MIKEFISLEWKQHFRSSYWQKNLALNIFLMFFALWISLSFLGLGVGLYPLLKNLYPEQDPFILVNGYLFYWLIGDLMLRFFLQKLPVMSVKPLLILPIKRNVIIHYVLGKSSLSFFNFLPFFIIIPFSVILVNNGYNVSTVLSWDLTLLVTVWMLNFVNFIIENLSAKTTASFLPIASLVGALYLLNSFNIISFTDIISQGILHISNHLALIIMPLLILSILYYCNFRILKNNLFLDSTLKSKVQEVNASSLEWTKRFGDIAPFLQLDLKLIWRNKRTKSMVMLLVFGVLYGLIFYPNPAYKDLEYFYSFIGVFSTGFFLINFGQFIPAWDSSYYKMLMSQNIKYTQYLKSKHTLMVISVVVLFLLTSPYVYFGWKILLVNFACAIYNIGVNTHIIMYGGAFNRKKINLDKRAAFNYQGTGAVQWLIGIPLMAFPMLIFGFTNWFINFEVAVAVLIVLGVLGIVLHEKLMHIISHKYKSYKYKMISAFSQEH